MTQAHDHDRFRNAAVYTVAVTYTVAGGARSATARRRAERVAERVASAATRLRDVVDVKAVAGPTSSDGDILVASRVRFAAANSGSGTYGEPDKLDRYLDPDHERALASLAEANARWRRHQEDDRRRRQAVGCDNAYRLSSEVQRKCLCVYCEPQRHLDTIRRERWGLPFDPPRRVCGREVGAPGKQCREHQSVQIVVLDQDSDALTAIASLAPGQDVECG